MAPLAASQRNQPDDVDVTHENPQNRTYSVEIDPTNSTGNPLEVKQGLNVRSGSAPVSTPNRHVRIVTDTNEGSRASQGVVTSTLNSNANDQLYHLSSNVVASGSQTVDRVAPTQYRASNGTITLPSITKANQMPVRLLHTNSAPMLSVSSNQGPIFSLPMGSSAPPFPPLSNVQSFVGDPIGPTVSHTTGIQLRCTRVLVKER